MKRIYLLLFLLIGCLTLSLAQTTGGAGGAGGAGGSTGATGATGAAGGGVSDAQVVSSAASQKRAGAKVQEITPAFTLLQPATVPVQKEGPKRARMCLVCLFLAFLALTVWVFYREDHLFALFMSDDDDNQV